MQTAAHTDPGGSPPLPLAGIRVLELGQVISAPYGGLLLAELGAEVIKIESPDGGDSSRNAEITGIGELSATFVTFNHNKRSLALDLKSPDDYATFAGLVTSADVVLTNMTPRVLRSLSADYDTLAALNPALILCAIQGFSGDDPRADAPSYDLTHQALSGLMLFEGQPGDPPLRMCLPIADLSSAQFAVNGILAALVARGRTGRGELVRVPMYNATLSLLTYTATLYLTSGKEPVRTGVEHEHTVPWQAVATADGDVVLAVRAERFWQRLCHAIERPDLIEDPRFESNSVRMRNRAELRSILEKSLAGHGADHWLRRLAEFGVPSAKVRTVKEALEAAQTEVAPMVQSYDQEGFGTVTLLGSPIEFGSGARLTVAAAPDLDEYRDHLR
ncbi:CoA transferase [Pseudonocardia sulfidoxydans NBRC 16205]|uniref:CoA transferase n=1 Tax=Pseudonocardia sulfidoxydans NBRC 16205 TaxID=1223511 RepID=A0A511DPM8_9PSEU|nr:CoA transferase [Pseudonocardia sulfidoxydans]GEL26770.1 CoA transferase [Pseudonocardia sulfidoxydans NBRC 16205]